MLFKNIKYSLYHIHAIVQKNIRLRLRYKYNIIISYIAPVISLILPIIIMGQFFNFNTNFGDWTSENFLVYQFIAFNIGIIKGFMGAFGSYLRQEKVYESLKLIMISPLNKINLLIGIFISYVILNCLPFIVVILICFLYYPVSFITFLSSIILFFLLALVFSGIGITTGIIALTRIGYNRIVSFIISIFFMFSCISFPFELFPEIIQMFINLNPFYYMFDIMRLTWIQNNILLTIYENLSIFITFTIVSLTFPIIGIYIFDRLYKKYGIEVD